MCLYYANKINLEEDLTVYKVFLEELRVFYTMKKTIISPYTGFEWEIGKIYEIKKFEPKLKIIQTKTLKDAHFITTEEKQVYGDAFHSYATIEGAQTLYNTILNDYGLGKDIAIYECVIPKNSHFVYTGHFVNCSDIEYASEKLKVIKKIEF